MAKEVSRIDKVTLVDFNVDALSAARMNTALNRVSRKCKFSNSETSSYLFSRYRGDEKFDYVDLDPFGTPVRQLQGGLSATSEGGILSLTATDTAVLCGVYPRVSARRYGALSVGNHFSHETGIRILVGAVARTGAQVDIGVEPLLGHSMRHYVRAFVKVRPGATRADESLKRIGYVLWCPHCGHVSSSESLQTTCSACGKRAKAAGPLWLQGLTNPSALKDVVDAAVGMKLVHAAKLAKSFDGSDGFPPWSFSIEKASSSMRVATVPEESVRDRLAESGWRAMRTPYEKTGIKTDAPYKDFTAAVRSASLATVGTSHS